MARIIRPGGRLAILEVAEPANPVLRFGHGLYFGHVVPFVGGLVSDASAYQYLPKSVEYLPEPAVMLTMLADAGFSDVDRKLLSGGISQLVTATRRAL
jgi:demethylmenaquinone methyltransferase/2-methoxy-6-polyprenyl-1,4-benzoquinol methylase